MEGQGCAYNGRYKLLSDAEELVDWGEERKLVSSHLNQSAIKQVNRVNASVDGCYDLQI